MPRLQFLVAEALVIVVGVAILAVVIVRPFGGEEGSASTNPEATAILVQPSDAGSSNPPPTSAPPSDGCAPAVDRSFLSANTVVSYYGNPYAETLGILGQHEPGDLVAPLSEQARAIDGLNGIRGVQPAFHLVWATAQAAPGDDGTYLKHVDEATTQEYIDIACRNGFLVFLDLQNGLNDPVDELRRIEPYLLKSNVHVALDPEFTMHDGQVPGQSLGHLDASQINAVQAELDRIVQENNLPDKILIVHQFDERMIHDREAIGSNPHVHLVIDMDGFGLPEVKIKKYGMFSQPAEHGGIKIFFEQDTPRLTDEQIVELDPEVIIYQ